MTEHAPNKPKEARLLPDKAWTK